MNLITIATSALANQSAVNGSMVTFGKPNAKTGAQKVGSFARAIAFATRDERLAAGRTLYGKWLSTGNFRPLIMDVLGVGLVSKDTAEYISRSLPEAGKQVPKEKLVEVCKFVTEVVANRVAAGKAEPKGEKAYVLGVVRAVAAEPEKLGDVVEAIEQQ